MHLGKRVKYAAAQSSEMREAALHLAVQQKSPARRLMKGPEPTMCCDVQELLLAALVVDRDRRARDAGAESIAGPARGEWEVAPGRRWVNR